ncbi:MAG: RimK family alpha-L-glutamate ligase [Rhodopila sp.]
MILVYGRSDDSPLVRTLEALQAAEASWLFLSQAALASEQLRIEVGPHGVGGTLVIAGQPVALERIHSIYARPLEPPTRAEDPASARRVQLLHEQLFEWLDVADALVVNRPRAMQSNASKPLQAQLIGAAGFMVPETLVTSDEREARAFWRRHGRVIFKSVSGIRSIVRELDENTAARLHRLSALPAQFQAYVPGVDVRVHVVGTKTFAAAIDSKVIDYRYAAREGAEVTLSAVELPESVRVRCITLAAELGLSLAGIDLRQTPAGEYVCFEVNPMPAFTYFENNTGLPIAQAVAELLITGNVTEAPMVQMVENLTQISGMVVSRKPHPTLADYDVVSLQIDAANPVSGKADLLGRLVGNTIDVTVRRALLGMSGPGAHLRCRAKRTLDGAMCEPHPDVGDIEIR